MCCSASGEACPLRAPAFSGQFLGRGQCAIRQFHFIKTAIERHIYIDDPAQTYVEECGLLFMTGD